MIKVLLDSAEKTLGRASERVHGISITFWTQQRFGCTAARQFVGHSSCRLGFSEIGSGGWSFGSHSGPSNHRLRIESFDQSQGYEPCGLNLATPPRYKRGSGFNWF